MKVDIERKTEQTDTLKSEFIKLTIKKKGGIINDIVFHTKVGSRNNKVSERRLFFFNHLLDWSEKEIAISILKETKSFITLALNYLGEESDK